MSLFDQINARITENLQNYGHYLTDPHAPEKLLFFGLYFIVLSIPICGAMILMADRFTGAMRRSPRAMRIFDWMFAGLMGTFALRLLLARGN